MKNSSASTVRALSGGSCRHCLGLHFVAVLLIALNSAPHAHAQFTTQFNATDDTRILANFPTSNGNGGPLAAYNDGTSNIQNTLIFFDLSSLSAYHQVTQATLTLTLDSFNFQGNNGGVPTYIYQLTKPWVESSVTWNTTDGSTPWTTPGGDMVGTSGTSLTAPFASNSTSVPGGNTVDGQTFTFDVTNLVNSWLAGMPNDGMAVVPSGAHTALEFYSNNTGPGPSISIDVPEPGAYAALAGLVALGISALRRHRNISN